MAKSKLVAETIFDLESALISNACNEFTTGIYCKANCNKNMLYRNNMEVSVLYKALYALLRWWVSLGCRRCIAGVSLIYRGSIAGSKKDC